MAKWKLTLDISDVWALAKSGEMKVPDLSKEISSRIRALPVVRDEDLDFEADMIAEDFEDLSTTQPDDLDADAFDSIMSDLYDWGDTKLSGDFFDAVKCCWIKTA